MKKCKFLNNFKSLPENLADSLQARLYKLALVRNQPHSLVAYVSETMSRTPKGPDIKGKRPELHIALGVVQIFISGCSGSFPQC